jgi:hypothetical protein
MKGHEALRAAGTSPRRRRLAARLAATILVVAILGPVAAVSAAAAIGPQGPGIQQHAPIDSIVADGVALSLPNAGPGDVAESYVTVRYRGERPAEIRLFGTTEGTGLDRYLALTITRGRGTGPGFVPDAADHLGLGPGVVFHGRLADLPDDAAHALTDPHGPWVGPETWTYRLRVRMTGANAAQGLTAAQTFSWTAVPVA